MILLLAGLALAQGLDASEPDPFPADGDTTRPVAVGSPPALPVGTGAVGAVLGHARAPLVRYGFDDGVETKDTLLGTVSELRLHAAWAPVGPLLVAGELPTRVHLAGREDLLGPALGDATLWAGLRTPPGPLSGALIGQLRLPTATTLSAGRARLALAASAAWRAERLALAASAGVGDEPPSDALDLPGGSYVRLGAAASWRPTSAVSVGIEGWTAPPVTATGRGAPAELLGTLRARAGPLAVQVGAGGALTGAAGLPTLRLLAGATWRLERAPPPLPPPEVAPAPRDLVVQSPDGRPIRGATVVAGDAVVGRTDAEGRVTRPPGVDVEVHAPGLLPATAPPLVDTLVLGWAPVPLEVRVVDAEGLPPPDVALDLVGPGVARQTAPGAYALAPGSWTLTVTAPGAASQERRIEVPTGRVEPLRAEVVLLPANGETTLALAVLDPEGRPVEDAVVLLDGQPVGSTASGGAVALAALEAGPHQVRIEAAGYLPVERTVEGDAAVTLAYAPGSVRVLVRGPDGAPVDGLLRMRGPAVLPPMRLGEDGERVVVVAPGTWTCRVSSPALGSQERVVVVHEDGPVPVLATFVLQAQAHGPAELVVRVQDRSGTLLEGAAVHLDGRAHGRTSTGGILRIPALPAGEHLLEVEREGLLPGRSTVTLGEGVSEAVTVLDWRPGTLRVLARTPAGEPPADALAVMSGPGEVPPTALGARADHTFRGLATGRWDLLVSAPAHGLQAREVVLPDQAGERVTARVLLGVQEEGEAALRVSVADPAGPVDGAVVTLDGRTLGETSGGVLAVSGLREGTRTVAVEAPGLHCPPREVALPAEVRVACEWGVGMVEVVVERDGIAVGDALLRVAGPRALPPFSVRPDGTRRFAVEPGTWRILVSSPTAGLAEREVRVAPDVPGLESVRFDLHATDVRLLVRVVDEAGRPVRGARVALGEQVARTAADGAALLDGVAGAASLRVEAEHHEPVPERVLELAPGPHEEIVVVRPLPVEVPVEVRDAAGAEVQARISAVGPDEVAPVDVSGAGTLSLPPGRWTLIASAEGLGTQRREVLVEAGEQAVAVVFSLGAAQAELTDEGIRLLRVTFGLDEDVADPSQASILEEVASILLDHPEIVRLEVQGHTDPTGELVYNMDLSQRRARSVLEALVAVGVPRSRLSARGYGPTRPVADNATAEGRAANRRVEFRILERHEGG